jgi:hypothetical protein
MKPARGMVLIVAAGIAATAALTAWLDVLATDRVRAQIAAAKDGYLLRTLRTAAEANVSIGLTLEQMDGLQGLIEREREGAESLLSIDVFNPNGVVVYSTDRSAIGTAVALPWVPRLQGDKTWTVEGRAERVIGTRFDNDLGGAEGGIAITQRGLTAARLPADPVAAMKAFTTPLVASLLAIALSALAAGLLLQRATSRFRRAAGLLTGRATAAPAPDDALSALALARRAQWARIRDALEERQRSLQRLDDAS